MSRLALVADPPRNGRRHPALNRDRCVATRLRQIPAVLGGFQRPPRARSRPAYYRDQVAQGILLDEVLLSAHSQGDAYGRIGSIDVAYHPRLDLLVLPPGGLTSTTSPISSRCAATSIAISRF
jgi:hypothetical protein